MMLRLCINNRPSCAGMLLQIGSGILVMGMIISYLRFFHTTENFDSATNIWKTGFSLFLKNFSG